MKIAILTSPVYNNYGGILQAFALQTVLRELGHNPYLLHRTFKNIPFWKKLVIIIRRFFIRFILLKKNSILIPFWATEKEKRTVNKYTNAFIEDHITTTSYLTSSRQLKKTALEMDFDAYIVGSDQVWRPKYSPCITNFFLDFIPICNKAKRISYAASFGVDHWEFSEKQTKKCMSLLRKFDAVSVREDSGVNLCHEYFDIAALHVLDPTLLLEKYTYANLVLKAKESQNNGSLMVYILDKSSEKEKVVNKVASDFDLTPYFVMPAKLDKETRTEINSCINPPVTKWIKGFIDAEFVVTDSFHGCIFSIIFNKPFFVIHNPERGLSRMKSLLKTFSIEHRLIESASQLTDGLMNNRIDWEVVNRTWEQRKSQSMEYLAKSLTR